MKRLRLTALLLACAILRPGAMAEPSSTDTHTWKSLPEWLPVRYPFHAILPPGLQFSEVRYQHGDDATWAPPDFNDRDWPQTTLHKIPVRTGIFWVRVRVRLPESQATFPDLFACSIASAYELFWDGERLGGTGRPGHDRTSEIAGPSRILCTIPADKRAAREHVIALRLSNHHYLIPRETTQLHPVICSSLADERLKWKNRLVAQTAAAALALLALTSLLLWLVAERTSRLLLLCGVFLSSSLFQIYGYLYNRNAHPYHYYYYWGNLTALLSALVGIALVGFLIHHFAMPRRRWLMAATVAGLAGWIALRQPYLGPLPQQLQFGAYAFAFFCALWAARKRRPGAWIAVVGIACTVLLLGPGPLRFLTADFLLRTLPLHLSLIAMLGLDIRARREKARQAELAAARLETELLKKTLQPHFLLNTLTALSQVVEENPAKAVQLIDDLAGEFRTLAALSGEKQIPLAREIELCRAHLRVMSVRTERDWHLETRGTDPDALVPPALVLTLIENSFSHQEPIDGQTVFTLGATAGNESVSYTFFAPGRIRLRKNTAPGGTGLRYLRARLEEGWPDNWTLDQTPVVNGWQTVITLKTPAHAHPDR